MTIHGLLRKTAFDPNDTQRLIAAYEQTLRTLGLTKRDDALTRLVAKKVIEIGQTGLGDPAQISALAIEQLGLPQPPP